jgi:tetratricopeptide (TPR) repeat protein
MSYTVREVAAMLGLTPAQIRSYAHKGFLEPARGARGELRFGFADLIVLRTAGELTTAHIPQRKVKRVLERLREQLPEGRALSGVRIAADGERVVVRDGETVWNPESGQSLFDFSVSEIEEKMAAPLPLRAVDDDEEDAEDWFELGSALEASDPERAQEAYENAIAHDPSHVDAHLNLGRLLHEAGEAAAAERHYRLASELAPDNATAAFNLGVALEDLQRPADALEAYRLALSLDPEHADAHYNLAGIHERRGEKAEAVQHLKAYRDLVRA